MGFTSARSLGLSRMHILAFVLALIWPALAAAAATGPAAADAGVLLDRRRGGRLVHHRRHQRSLAVKVAGDSLRHPLTKHELRAITSVDCLRRRQRDPTTPCSDAGGSLAAVANASAGTVHLDAGNFPSYEDPACFSNGAFLCDPQQVLTAGERSALAAELEAARAAAPVPCGRLQADKVETEHLQPFYLGVVILKDWPLSESGPDSLQRLGQIIAGGWKMDKLYVGSLRPYARCTNTGILFVLPGSNQVFLSTVNCEFICQAQDGAAVSTPAVLALRRGNSSEAATLAVRAVASYLQARHPTADWKTISGTSAVVAANTTEVAAEDNSGAWVGNLVQRLLFVVAVGLLLFSFGIGLLVVCWAPGHAAKRQLP
eukprot:TRINITY_DN32254_c0_g1_i1.p1 TRINITY_DN32254_c0_g1~~TRINITY_DN32254_c0_g1_i1.p1  ORF type:complete len:373 (-),score=73.90 TRINITY_DN32254_c0_g1_i1:75-1193(-)